MEYVSKRAIRYGKYVDIYEYEKPYLRGYQIKKPAGRVFSKPESEKKTDFSLNRAHTAIRRIVNANPNLDKFVTLTFADWVNLSAHSSKGLNFEYVGNNEDIAQCNQVFMKFCQRLKHVVSENLQYFCVPELQKSNTVHYHFLADLPFLEAPKLANIWRYGFVKINRVDKVSNIGAYVSKYLTKDNSKEKLSNKKAYFCSRNLKKPSEIPVIALDNMRLITEKKIDFLETEYSGIVHFSINRIIAE